MARKFGNRKKVSKNINDFMIGIMAPSGWGKTTLMYETCEKLFGPEGYIVADMGDEDGTAAIDDIAAEKIPTWKKFKEMVDDIVKNKDTDYSDLKIVILDTLDASFEKAEDFTVKSWNQENMGQQGFKPASSVNSVEGGFGKGLDRTIETVKKEINRLAKVGVKVWWTAHVKEKDQTDLFTGTNYTTLTANMPMKYFNSIKNISHIIGFGYFDRTVEKQEVGEANKVTKKKKTRNAVLDETRKIKFRDDSMIADAKSRFANIVDEIVLDTDEFIKAIQDAINSASTKSDDMSTTTLKNKSTKKPEPVVSEPDPEEDSDTQIDEDFDIFGNDEEPQEEEAVVPVDKETLTEIRSNFKSSDADTKSSVRTILANYNGKLSSEMKPSDVEKIKTILGI